MRLLGQEEFRENAAPSPADADPAAILVKIAEATAGPPPRDDAADDIWRTPGMHDAHSTYDTDPRWTSAAAPITQSLAPAAPQPPFDHRGHPEPEKPKSRARAAALVIAALVAVAGTVGGAAYVTAQSSPGGVQHVNNPSIEPVASESPTETPSPTVSENPTPVIRSTRPSPTPESSTPTETKTTKMPSKTPTKTRTPTRTPTITPSTPDPSTGPAQPAAS
jgi:hypothetical protein